MKTLTPFILLVFGFAIQAQTLDSIQQLEEVVVSADRLLKPFSQTQITKRLLDSTMKRNASSLTQVLSFNSPIYFKENGLGMVSSPAFRGTTAQQTAVVWNGININSQFNGQTDFNTINTRSFDDITIRYGGGSVLYGSGAIGGSVHLKDRTIFETPFENEIFISYGSFNTQDVSYKAKYGNEKLSIGFTTAYTRSDNDYDYKIRNITQENLNGEFYNLSFSTQLGYKLNSKNTLRYFNYIFDSERHFSLLLPTETPTKYQDFNTRQLLEWEYKSDKIISVLRTAYLTESYKYYGNIERDSYSFGKAKTFVGNYQFNYQWVKAGNILASVDVNHTNGEGSSIPEAKRTITAFNVLVNQNIKSFYYEAAVRKEITNNYESPILFSAGLSYRFSELYKLRLNGSRNFRMPTYNDLFWAGAGNPDLNPESSYQLELGNNFNFKNFEFQLTGFYNDIDDMIRWVPNSNGVWRPINTDHVKTYGLEFQATFNKKLGNHKIQLNSNYSYTIAENQFNNKQLIYVPYHNASGSVNYGFKKWKAYWQVNFVGEVFTQSDNDPNRVLDAYWLHNLGVEYKVLKNLPLGLRVQNILNENYQSVANRYMPGVNYNLYINFNF